MVTNNFKKIFFQFTLSQAVCKNFSFSKSLIIFDIVSSKILIIFFFCCVVITYWGFHLHFYDDKCLNNCFMYLLTMWTASLWNALLGHLLIFYCVVCLFLYLSMDLNILQIYCQHNANILQISSSTLWIAFLLS